MFWNELKIELLNTYTHLGTNDLNSKYPGTFHRPLLCFYLAKLDNVETVAKQLNLETQQHFETYLETQQNSLTPKN